MIISLKKILIPLFFLLFTVSLIFFSNSNLIAAKNGLITWANNIIPALFPFFVATELLSYTEVCQKVSKFFYKIMRPLFNIPGSGAYAFILGIISGYPVGAKIVTMLYNAKQCTKDEANRMLAFTNNSGPLFILGTIGILLFRNSLIGILLLITHILSSITIGIILGLFSNRSVENNNDYNSFSSTKVCSFSNLGEILSSSILNSIKTILLIGGFVVIFSCLVSILNESHLLDILYIISKPIFNLFNIDVNFIKPIFTGLIELTNGVTLISSVQVKKISINIILCAFLLGFGGISVLLQVWSIIAKSGLSIKIYFYSKLLQGIIAAFYTYILLNTFSIFYFNF